LQPLNEQELRAEIAAYCACVSHLDAQVGRMLAALRDAGKLEKTLVIFSSDQGLALGSHGLLGKQNLYEHTFRVPLIFSGPGIKRGARSDADCYLRDVFPTTCELAEVAIPETVESRSLAALLHGGTQPVYDFVTGYYNGTHRALRRGDWKLIFYPQLGKTQFFNLQEDPDEVHDLADIPAHRGMIQAMQTQLDRWSEEQGDTFQKPPGKK
jgi:arylsulfatase A-like enzyme